MLDNMIEKETLFIKSVDHFEKTKQKETEEER